MAGRYQAQNRIQLPSTRRESRDCLPATQDSLKLYSFSTGHMFLEPSGSSSSGASSLTSSSTFSSSSAASTLDSSLGSLATGVCSATNSKTCTSRGKFQLIQSYFSLVSSVLLHNMPLSGFGKNETYMIVWAYAVAR